MATTPQIGTSSSGSPTLRRKGSSPISASELRSLQKYLDGDWQNFWDIRRCGKGIGFAHIDCPVCGFQPQIGARVGDNFIWYSYRKYKAVLTHVVTAHCHQQALTHRRIAAEEKRKQATAKQNNKAA